MITNNIQESYCSFEVSKLLKDKGFEVICKSYYRYDGVISFWEDRTNANNKNLQKTLYSRPTHFLAIEWIRVNSGLWISILRSYGENGLFKYSIYHTDRFSNTESKYEFNSPQEATEAALLYTLKNLIK